MSSTSSTTRNWLDLPSDLTVNILQRIGVIDILQNAQDVCTAWREICKDPAMWRVISLEYCIHPADPDETYQKIICHGMFVNAVSRSQGQLVDLTMAGFCDDELLQFVADRSTQLRRLVIEHYWEETYEIWSDAFKKLSLLEELSLVRTIISGEHIESVGRHCPLLELIGSGMTNIGLQAILDGCCHLESLDLRQCLYVDLKGDLGERCSHQIKYLKRPRDSIKGYMLENEEDDEDYDYDVDHEYDAYYDDYPINDYDD